MRRVAFQQSRPYRVDTPERLPYLHGMEKVLAVVLIALSLPTIALSEMRVPKDRPIGNYPPPAARQMWAKSVIGQKAPGIVVEKWLTPTRKRRKVRVGGVLGDVVRPMPQCNFQS